MTSLRNIRHDPVQRDVFVTSKHRTLGGVEWFRQTQFPTSGDPSSGIMPRSLLIIGGSGGGGGILSGGGGRGSGSGSGVDDGPNNYNSWSVLANISKANAPMAVDRPKRNALVPDFGKMRSHQDLLHKNGASSKELNDDRPPLHPVFDFASKSSVKMVKPKPTAAMLERIAKEKRRKELEKRKAEQDIENSFFGGGGNNNKHHSRHVDEDGDDDDDDDDDPFGTSPNKKKKKKNAQDEVKKETAHQILSKEKPDPNSIHGTAVFSKQGERFPTPTKNKNENGKSKNNSNIYRGTFLQDNEDDPHLISSSSNDPEERARLRNEAKKEFVTLTHKFQSDDDDYQRQLKKQSAAAAKFVEYDYEKDPDGVGKVVDFSSKPFRSTPSWSFGNVASGENVVQRKKRQDEETKLAEAEYALKAKYDKININNNNHGENNLSDNNSNRLGRAIDFSRYSGREDISAIATDLDSNNNNSRKPNEKRLARSRKEQFLDLFRAREAKLHSPGSPFFQNLHARARTPEINSGCLLGSGGTSGGGGVGGSHSKNDASTSSSSAANRAAFDISDLVRNADASVIRAEHAVKLYRSASRDLVKRTLNGSSPMSLMKNNNPNHSSFLLLSSSPSAFKMNDNGNEEDDEKELSESRGGGRSGIGALLKMKQQREKNNRELIDGEELTEEDVKKKNLISRSPAFKLLFSNPHLNTSSSSKKNKKERDHHQISKNNVNNNFQDTSAVYSSAASGEYFSASSLKPPLADKKLNFGGAQSPSFEL